MHPLAAVLFSLVVAVPSTGCSSSAPSVEAAKPEDDVKPVAPPKELVGKWRLELKEGNTTKTSVFTIQKDGRVEVDSVIKSTDRELKDTVKSAITKIEGAKLTLVDLSRTGSDGIEGTIRAERRQPRTLSFRVDGGSLTWGPREDQAKSPVWELKRVKE
jgi:hypothetical protein